MTAPIRRIRPPSPRDSQGLRSSHPTKYRARGCLTRCWTSPSQHFSSSCSLVQRCLYSRLSSCRYGSGYGPPRTGMVPGAGSRRSSAANIGSTTGTSTGAPLSRCPRPLGPRALKAERGAWSALHDHARALRRPELLEFTFSRWRPRRKQLVEIDDPAFEEAFTVTSNDAARDRWLLDDAQLRHTIGTTLDRGGLSCGTVSFRRRSSVRWLHYTVEGLIADRDRLRALRSMFLLTMDRLEAINVATRDDPEGV